MLFAWALKGFSICCGHEIIFCCYLHGFWSFVEIFCAQGHGFNEIQWKYMNTLKTHVHSNENKHMWNHFKSCWYNKKRKDFVQNSCKKQQKQTETYAFVRTCVNGSKCECVGLIGAGWLVGWAGWLAGWLAGLVAGLGGWLGWLGWLGCVAGLAWLAGWLAGR